MKAIRIATKGYLLQMIELDDNRGLYVQAVRHSDSISHHVKVDSGNALQAWIELAELLDIDVPD